MSFPSYIIGCGYHARPHKAQAMDWFWRVWLDNTRKYASPREVLVLASGGTYPELVKNEPATNWIYLSGDLGHCGDIIHGLKPHHFSGGSAAWMTLAMLAYANEADFIYKEQDVLAFGPWVETMYSEIGTHGCIFGRARTMPCANSVFLVKHAFIPEFLRLYLGTAHERDPNEMCESKFPRLEQQRPDLYCRYSFGVDRDRPFDVKAKVWYAQKFSPAELKALAQAGLIPEAAVEDMPPVSGTVSND